MAYHRETGGLTLTFLRGADALGGSWGTPLDIQAYPGTLFGDYMSMAVIGGIPSIAYVDAVNDELRYLRATEVQGASWGAPVTVDTLTEISNYLSMIEVNNGPGIAYYDDATGNLKYAYGGVSNVLDADENGIIDFVDNPDDADADPTNEIQDLAAVLAEGDDAGGADALNLGRLDVIDTAVVGNILVGTQSTAQENSTVHDGDGFVTTPWVYSNAIEAQGERGFAGTLITVGNDGNFGGNDQIHLVTTGSSRLAVDSDGDVGIGTTSPDHPLHVSADKTGAAIGDHVARIENTSANTTTSGLAIKMNAAPPSILTNFITFFNTSNVAIGAIEGTGGGVTNASVGSDYAEYLPRLDPAEMIEAGDVVGVFGGRVSKRTDGADWVMAVSTAPNTLGNMPRTEEAKALHEKIAFLGQAPVKVRGPVATGDFIVASGEGDGMAVAVPFDAIRPEQSRLVVGRAWEASSKEVPKLVNTTVGLPAAHSMSDALNRIVRDQQAELESVKERLARIEAMLEPKVAHLD